MSKNKLSLPRIPFASENAAEDYFLSDPALRLPFVSLHPVWQKRFLEFFAGKKTLPLTYDSTFKTIFHPDVHPDRLSRLISSLLGQPVKVLRILPNEDCMSFQDALLVMDILVELEDGSLANVEIQKIPYKFPGERMCCYSSDLIMRQYVRAKGEKGQNFTYQDIKRVYAIVILETSPGNFHRSDGKYIHYGRTRFDTGLEMEMLQHYCLVALDVFRENGYTKDDSEQTGWLSLLATQKVSEMEALIRRFPWLRPIYEEMQSYMRRPKEVLNMFSEALRILDENTAHYMIEEMQQEIDTLKAGLAEKDSAIAEKDTAIAAAIAEKDSAIAEKDSAIAEKDAIIEQLKSQLNSQK